MNKDMGTVLAIVASSVMGIVLLSDPRETTKLLSATAIFMFLVVGVGFLENYLNRKRLE